MKRSKSKTKDKPSTEVIDYFPRGNTSSHQNDFTFNTGYVDNKKDRTNFLSKKRKTTSHKDNKAQTQLHNENEGVHIEKAIDNESSKVLLPKFKLGDLVLLSVCEIRKDYMIASYSRNKKAMIHSSYSGINVDDSNDSDFDFENYFHIGQFICGAVIRHGNDIRLDNGHVNKKILVTIDPKIVNTGLMPQHVVEGMDLYGQLLKNKDGKYMVDFRLGNDNEEEEEEEEENEENEVDNDDKNDNINKIKENEVNYVVNLIDDNNDTTLFSNKRVGSYYYFKVVKTYYKHKKLNIDVSIDITTHKFPLKSLDFPHIRPGFLFKANITRELSNGKECAYGGNIGSIFIDHVHNETKTKNILVRVVHVATSKRRCGLSSLPHIKALTIADIKTKRKLIGQTASNAKVTKLLYGNSLQVSIQLNSTEYFAFMHKNHIQPVNSSNTDKETQINDTFPLVYIKEYNYFDDCPIVECISNDNSNNNNSNMITWDTLHIGQSVQCTIKEVNSNNDIIVKLNSYIEGKIPLMHLTNTPLKKVPKSIVKGKELTARIFELNIKTKKIVLTAKECLNDNDVILHSTINEIKEGDDVNVIYIGKGIFIHSNNIKGRLIQFKSLNENELKIGNVYKYKVYKIDHEKEKVYYTMQKTTFSNSNSNKKGTPKQIGDVVMCVINGIKGNYIYCVFNKKKIGRIDINTFNGNVNQIKKLLEQTVQIRKQSVDNNNNNGDESKNASISALKVKAKVVNVSVSKKSDMKIYDLVVIDNDTDTNDDNTVIHDNISTTLNTSGNVLNTGIIAAVKQTSKHPLIITINSPEQITLKLPFSEIPISNITENGITYKPGNKIQFYMNSSHEIFLSKPTTLPQQDQTPIIGNVYPCRILKQIPGRGIILDLNFPSKLEIFVDICEITDYLHYNPLTYFNKNQITKCRIISRNDTNNIYNASLRASIINDDDYHTITQGSTLEFSQRYGTNSSFDLRNKIMKYGITNSIELNTLAIGYITSSSEKGVFIKLANNVIARASLHELSDDSIGISKQYLLYKENNICLCRVISLYKASDNADMKVNVSLRKSVIKYGMFVKKKDIALNNFYLCNVLAKGKKGYDVNIVGSTFVGVLKYKKIKKGSESAIEVGGNVVLQVVKLDNEGALHKSKIRFSNENIGSDFNMELVVNNMKEDMIAKAKENEEVYDSIRDIIENAKKESEMNELIDMNDGVVKDNEIDFEELVEKEAKRRKLSVASSLQNDNDVDMDDDDNDNEVNENEENESNDDIINDDIITDQQEKIGLLSGIGGINETSNKMDIDDDNVNDDNVMQDDNSDNNDDNDQSNTKQQTAAQREKNRLLTEMQIREKENASTTETQSAEYYEKLILSDRNNSLNWISYASYILSNLGANSARQIFKRAIKTIDIANLQDKSNIWIAYINLEHLYGTPETFRTTVEEALEVNEKKPIYTALIKIYLNSNNYKMANEIYLLSLKDYFNDVTLWKQYIKFLFNVNYSDKQLNSNNDFATCKDGLNRALQVIVKKQHLDMMVYYSGLLYEYGSYEEARNMFDNIVKGVPKRIDIWMVYVDKEIKYGNNISKVRQLFDRVFDKDLKEKQLRLVCKKYLEFESKNAKNEKEIEQAKAKVNAVIQDKMSKINNTTNDGVDNNDNEE